MQLVWFRRDLRVEDNTALQQALRSGDAVVAAFVATPVQWQEHHLAPIQADLIYRRLFELQRDLSALDVPLLYAEEARFSDAVAVVTHWAHTLGAVTVHLNKEYELNEVRRDNDLQEALADVAIDCQQHDDKCALPPGTVLNQQGNYFKVFTPFKKAYLKRFYEVPLTIKRSDKASQTAALGSLSSDVLSNEAPFSYERHSSNAYPVDTRSVIDTMRDYCAQSVEQYHQVRDFPAQDATSRLSPYLAIGALSVRQCFARLSYGHPHLCSGREVWQSELIWREFYQHLLHFEPKLSRSEDFVPWGRHLEWWSSEKHLQAWKEGRTGYPIVDAAMRQLNQTGWMHNRLRMVVASFLTKDLHVDWREGEKYFMSKLIDGDYAANNGGWQWCASTGCDGQPYFRIFNPVSQGEKFDTAGRFVRQWVPELADVPDKWIHQPWKWPGVKSLSYPSPIVDHKAEREITLRLYKEAKDN